MTDHFEQAQQKILREARENGGVTSDHLLDALIATNEDLDDQHAQTKEWHTEISQMVAAHIKEAETRDFRLTKLEAYNEETARTCAERVRALIIEEHDVRHMRHVEECHGDDSTFQTRLVWFFASTIGKVALVVLGIIAGILLNLLVYGRP